MIGKNFFKKHLIQFLIKVLNSPPKKYRTIKAKKNPLIMEKNIATTFNDEYSKLGDETLKGRAEFIKKIEIKLLKDFAKLLVINFKKITLIKHP